MSITVDQLLARARTALGHGTLYWLKAGGLDPAAAVPTTLVPVAATWKALDAAKRAELQPLVDAMGIDVNDTGLNLPAADCSGFVCWALGFSRRTSERGAWTTSTADAAGHYWIYTGSIHQDATTHGERFQQIAKARPGALVVYPEGDGEDYGHIAIVVEADADGRATQIIHCAKNNIFTAPHDGIKITDAQQFADNRHSVYAWCRDVAEP